ncbi:MAG: Endonuclease 4 [candidate division BRC1 bacterium ADurb.Bin183]|nr:MAG: Endonuclease 4 [candidate division BRC1 bacterium ADurb.Bin183]
MSIAGGIDKAILRGDELSCTAVQIFLKNNTRWEGKPISEKERSDFFANQKKTGLNHIVAHNCYLINLASPDETIFKKSMRAMSDELTRASFLQIPSLIIHPGAHKGMGTRHGINQIAGALNALFKEDIKGKVKILLETTAGQGTGIGSRFEDLAQIISDIKRPARVGVCLDTSHIFAAGYDIRTKKDYESTLKEFDSIIGIKKLCAIHLNDSKKPLGSRLDRYENIGKGSIGLDAFRFIMNDERFAEIPKIIETPKEPEPQADLENLRILKSLVESIS